MVKKDLNILLDTKIFKKVDFWVYFSQKWQDIGKTLMKLNLCLFLIKDDEVLEKYNEIWENVKGSLKKLLDSKPVYNKNL